MRDRKPPPSAGAPSFFFIVILHRVVACMLLHLQLSAARSARQRHENCLKVLPAKGEPQAC